MSPREAESRELKAGGAHRFSGTQVRPHSSSSVEGEFRQTEKTNLIFLYRKEKKRKIRVLADWLLHLYVCSTFAFSATLNKSPTFILLRCWRPQGLFFYSPTLQLYCMWTPQGDSETTNQPWLSCDRLKEMCKKDENKVKLKDKKTFPIEILSNLWSWNYNILYFPSWIMLH